MRDFYGVLKRGANCVYHHVSRDHRARCGDAFVLRCENREMSDHEGTGRERRDRQLRVW